MEKNIRVKFEKYSNYIIDEIVEIDAMFDAYIGTYNKLVDHVELINISPGFWSLVYEAFLYYSVLKLAKLYDGDNSVISIEKYINFIEQNLKYIYKENEREIVKKQVRNIKKCLEEKKDIIGKIKTVRDKMIAHNDKKIILEETDLFEEMSFIIAEIHMLIDIVKEIINTFWEEYSDEYEILEIIDKNDYERIFEALEMYKNNLDKKVI